MSRIQLLLDSISTKTTAKEFVDASIVHLIKHPHPTLKAFGQNMLSMRLDGYSDDEIMQTIFTQFKSGELFE